MDFNWSDPSTYASTASDLGTSIGALATGITGFKQAVNPVTGVVQTTPAIAGPVAQSTVPTPPSLLASWGAKLGVPVAVVVTGLIALPLLLVFGLWKFLK